MIPTINHANLVRLIRFEAKNTFYRSNWLNAEIE